MLSAPPERAVRWSRKPVRRQFDSSTILSVELFSVTLTPSDYGKSGRPPRWFFSQSWIHVKCLFSRSGGVGECCQHLQSDQFDGPAKQFDGSSMWQPVELIFASNTTKNEIYKKWSLPVRWIFFISSNTSRGSFPVIFSSNGQCHGISRWNG